MLKKSKFQFLSHNNHISSTPMTTSDRGYIMWVWSLNTVGLKDKIIKRGTQATEK